MVVKRVSYALQSSFCAENPNKWCVILNICATRSRGHILYLGTCFWISWFGVIADIWHLWKSSKSSNNYPSYYKIVFSSFSSNSDVAYEFWTHFLKLHSLCLNRPMAKIASFTQKEKGVGNILAHLNIRVTWPLQPRCERSWSWNRLQSAFPPRSSSKMCYSKSSSILFQQSIWGFFSTPPGLWREVDLLSRATRWSWKDFVWRDKWRIHIVTTSQMIDIQYTIYRYTKNTCCWSHCC